MGISVVLLDKYFLLWGGLLSQVEIREEIIEPRYSWMWLLASFFLKLLNQQEISVASDFILKSSEDILESIFGLRIWFHFMLGQPLWGLASLFQPHPADPSGPAAEAGVRSARLSCFC